MLVVLYTDTALYCYAPNSAYVEPKEGGDPYHVWGIWFARKSFGPNFHHQARKWVKTDQKLKMRSLKETDM